MNDKVWQSSKYLVGPLFFSVTLLCVASCASQKTNPKNGDSQTGNTKKQKELIQYSFPQSLRARLQRLEGPGFDNARNVNKLRFSKGATALGLAGRVNKATSQLEFGVEQSPGGNNYYQHFESGCNGLEFTNLVDDDTQPVVYHLLRSDGEVARPKREYSATIRDLHNGEWTPKWLVQVSCENWEVPVDEVFGMRFSSPDGELATIPFHFVPEPVKDMARHGKLFYLSFRRAENLPADQINFVIVELWSDGALLFCNAEKVTSDSPESYTIPVITNQLTKNRPGVSLDTNNTGELKVTVLAPNESELVLNFDMVEAGKKTLNLKRHTSPGSPERSMEELSAPSIEVYSATLSFREVFDKH